MIPISIRVEAAGPTKQTVLDILQAQAKNFFGDEEFQLDGYVRFDAEVYSLDGVKQYRWAGLADYVNFGLEDR